MQQPEDAFRCGISVKITVTIEIDPRRQDKDIHRETRRHRQRDMKLPSGTRRQRGAAVKPKGSARCPAMATLTEKQIEANRQNEARQWTEFKALNEFCETNGFKYEVLAVSLFTKQVVCRLK